MRTFSNGVNQPTSLTPTTASPLDTRLVVDTRDDLINPNLWEFEGVPRYEGQIVAVVYDSESSNNGVYYLRNYDYKDTIGGQGWLKLSDEPLELVCYVDNITLLGTGTQDDPFYVALVDGGSY